MIIGDFVRLRSGGPLMLIVDVVCKQKGENLIRVTNPRKVVCAFQQFNGLIEEHEFLELTLDLRKESLQQ